MAVTWPGLQGVGLRAVSQRRRPRGPARIVVVLARFPAARDRPLLPRVCIFLWTSAPSSQDTVGDGSLGVRASPLPSADAVDTLGSPAGQGLLGPASGLSSPGTSQGGEGHPADREPGRLEGGLQPAPARCSRELTGDARGRVG